MPNVLAADTIILSLAHADSYVHIDSPVNHGRLHGYATAQN